MSTVGQHQHQQQQQQSRYPLRSRFRFGAATDVSSEVIDLTRSTPSPQPSTSNSVGNVIASSSFSVAIDLTGFPASPQPGTSTGIPNEAVAIAAAVSASSSAVSNASAIGGASQGTDLYTQLQNLEQLDGVIWNPEQMSCARCDLFVGAGGGIWVRNCFHQLCTTCIKKVIIDCRTVDVKCPIPDCRYSLEVREVHSLLTQAEYEWHMNKSTVVESTNLYKDLLDLEQQGVIYNTEKFECKICFTETDPGEGISIRECLHQYCNDCIRQTINHSEEARIKCPSDCCTGYIHDREIRVLLPQNEFEKYAAKTLRIAESQEKNSYHCKLANCRGWCIVEDEVNTFDCPVCSSQNCLQCQVKIVKRYFNQ